MKNWLVGRSIHCCEQAVTLILTGFPWREGLGTSLQPVLIWICGRSCYQNIFIPVKMSTVPWLAEANQSCVALTEWTTCSEVCRIGISFVTVRFKEFYSGSKVGSNVKIHWVLWVYLATLRFLSETAGIIVSFAMNWNHNSVPFFYFF